MCVFEASSNGNDVLFKDGKTFSDYMCTCKKNNSPTHWPGNSGGQGYLPAWNFDGIYTYGSTSPHPICVASYDGGRATRVCHQGVPP